jgi:hypothetical protein
MDTASGAQLRELVVVTPARPRREAGRLQSGRLLRQCIGKLRAAATRPAWPERELELSPR